MFLKRWNVRFPSVRQTERFALENLRIEAPTVPAAAVICNALHNNNLASAEGIHEYFLLACDGNVLFVTGACLVLNGVGGE